MSSTNDLKEMSADEVKVYIRRLERQTKTEPVTPEKLDGMSFFEWEDYAAELEKERGFAEMKSET